MAKIEIYSTDHCPYCHNAKQLFAKLGVEYHEYRVDQDAKKLTEMQKRSQGAKSVPQIFIDDRHIGGYSDLLELKKKNKLAAMLGNN